jgi:multimeric flavodoxin WrbA
MKIIAFNGSPRKNGNTSILLKRMLTRFESMNITTDYEQIGGQLLHGCTACGKCRELKNGQCVIKSDPMNTYIKKMIEADGIIIGSPTYFATLTPEAKALIDRAGYVTRGNGNLLKRKIGAAVSAVRRAGSLNVFQAINNFFLINEMIVPGSSYWNLAMGGGEGSVEQDEEGLNTMDTLAENFAWLLNKTSALVD